MIDHSHLTAATNLVAIDVAKEWNVVLVQDRSGRRRSFKFANRRADHDDFVSFLHSLDGSVQVGLEPTGDFHRNIAYRLLAEGSMSSRSPRWHWHVFVRRALALGTRTTLRMPRSCWR